MPQQYIKDILKTRIVKEGFIDVCEGKQHFPLHLL